MTEATLVIIIDNLFDIAHVAGGFALGVFLCKKELKRSQELAEMTVRMANSTERLARTLVPMCDAPFEIDELPPNCGVNVEVEEGRARFRAVIEDCPMAWTDWVDVKEGEKIALKWTDLVTQGIAP